MEKEKLIIVGSSGHAKVVIDIVEKEEKYEIIGLIDDHKKMGESTLGHPVIGTTESLQNLLKLNREYKLFVAIGDNWNRSKIVEYILSLVPQAEFVSTIHPSAQIAKEVNIGRCVCGWLRRRSTHDLVCVQEIETRQKRKLRSITTS